MIAVGICVAELPYVIVEGSFEDYPGGTEWDEVECFSCNCPQGESNHKGNGVGLSSSGPLPLYAQARHGAGGEPSPSHSNGGVTKLAIGVDRR